MATRRLVSSTAVAFVLCVYPAAAATFRTTNFTVDAASPELARQFGEQAEHFRKLKAREWLGEEMPNWQHPCPIKVTISMDGPSGATTFDFGKTPISQYMQISGPKERLLNSVLPHEVTHTVFAYYFRQPVPRWADEGGSVLSEDDIERGRHDQMCRQMLNQGQAMQLGYLFSLKDYPKDVMVLYAEGFSITRFLVDQADRKTFLQFVNHGMKHGWDNAVQTHYQMQSVRQLESAWIDSLRKPRSTTVAGGNTKPGAFRASPAELTGRRQVRTTDPPAFPDLTPGTARGSGATLGTAAERFGSSNSPGNRPQYLPELDPPPPPLPPPAPIPLPQQPARLGTPSLR